MGRLVCGLRRDHQMKIKGELKFRKKKKKSLKKKKTMRHEFSVENILMKKPD